MIAVSLPYSLPHSASVSGKLGLGFFFTSSEYIYFTSFCSFLIIASLLVPSLILQSRCNSEFNLQETKIFLSLLFWRWWNRNYYNYYLHANLSHHITVTVLVSLKFPLDFGFWLINPTSWKTLHRLQNTVGFHVSTWISSQVQHLDTGSHHCNNILFPVHLIFADSLPIFEKPLI